MLLMRLALLDMFIWNPASVRSIFVYVMMLENFFVLH
jgi:hypothetical protein